MRQTLVVSFVSFAAFAALATRVSVADATPWLDDRILRFVPAKNESNSLLRITDVLVPPTIVVGVVAVSVALLALIAGRRWRAALFWFSIFGGVIVLDVTLKPLFERPPVRETSHEFSFPSGNAMASMALLLGALTLVSGRRARRVLFFAGAGIVVIYGTALVYLSWHYPSDVLAGWLLSMAWVSFLVFAIRPPIVLAFNRSRATDHNRPGTGSGARA